MEMLNVMYELTTTKSALEMAETTIRKQKGKLLRKNLLIAGLLWFGLTSCKMLDEVDKKPGTRRLTRAIRKRSLL